MFIDLPADGSDIKSEKEKARNALKQKLENVRHIDPQKFTIAHLVTSKVFNPQKSAMELHNIKTNDIVNEDPSAFIEAWMLPDPQQTAIAEKKHGGV